MWLKNLFGGPLYLRKNACFCVDFIFRSSILVYPTKLIKSIAELILKLDPKCWKNVQKLEFSQRYSRTKKQFFVVFVHISHTSITSLYLEDQIDCRINIKTGTEMLKKRSKTWVFSKVPNRQWHFRCGFNRSNFLFCLVRLMTQGYFGSFFFSNINWKNWEEANNGNLIGWGNLTDWGIEEYNRWSNSAFSLSKFGNRNADWRKKKWKRANISS